MSQKNIAALVLAGGQVKDKHAASWEPLLPPGTRNRALLELGGKPMYQHVVAALQATPGVSRILLAGDVPLLPGCIAVSGGDSMVDTLLNGVAALQPDETRFLVVTADIPFLTPQAVTEVLDSAPARADFVYSIIPAQVCYDAFPEMRRTTLKLAEGEFTGGNIVVLNPEFLRTKEAVVRHAYALRKNVPGLAALLGPATILRLLASRVAPSLLTLPQLEAAVGRLLGGAVARAIIVPHAGVGADVDHPEDVPIARRALGPER